MLDAMTEQRHYRFTLTGRISVDDTTLKAAALGRGLDFVLERMGDVSDDERVAMELDLASSAGNVYPEQLMRAYLEDSVPKGVKSDMGDAEIDVEVMVVCDGWPAA
jgi:hypothetical protein